jgi:hypothetical protein
VVVACSTGRREPSCDQASPQCTVGDTLHPTFPAERQINGIDDFLNPYELSLQPLFELLGAPDDRKRHARLTRGHIPMSRLDIREVVDWLDLRLGPVRRVPAT